MQIYVIALIVVVLLIAILFFALRSTVKRIDYNTRKYFVDKLQDYDYLIEEKQSVLNKLNTKIEENKKNLSQIKTDDNKEDKDKNLKYYNNITIPKYSDENLFKKYKTIKEKFELDYEKIILNFINNNLESDKKDYNLLFNARKKFSNDTVYKIILMKKNEQMKYALNLLTKEEVDIVKKYININKIEIKNFITKMDIIIEKMDPMIYVLTGNNDKNFNSLSNRINTIYDSDINEGIKIRYKGIIYDYSL